MAAARRLVRRFAGDLEVDLDAVELAVSEAVANAVVHAYDDGRGTVELEAAAAPYELQIVVRDRGRGIRAGATAAPASDWPSSAGWRSTWTSPTPAAASR